MITSEQITQVGELVAAAGTILIMISDKASYDQTAAAITLFLGLQAQGKQVSIHAPGGWSRSDEGLTGLENIQATLGNQQLQVSFPYQPENVDKVSYHIDEESNQFYLVVKPQPGHQPLDSSKVQMTYAGASADLVFLIGVKKLDDLDYLYTEFESLYTDATTIVLATYTPSFGQVKLDAAGSSCVSEALAQLLPNWGVTLTAEMASNLLAGIEDVTNSFASHKTTAETLEVAGSLLRAGARRLRRATPKSSSGKAATKNSVVPEAVSSGESTDLMAALQRANKSPKAGGLDYQPSGFGPKAG